MEEGAESIVGVNRYATDRDSAIPTLKIEQEVERAQVERLRAMRARLGGHQLGVEHQRTA